MEKIEAPEPGVYYDIPFEDYLKWDAFSKSMVAPLQKSPLHLLNYMKEGKAVKEFAFGNALEDWLLEQDKFWENYAILPETYTNKKGEVKPFTLKSSDCREIKAQYESRGFTMIDTNTLNILKDIEMDIDDSHLKSLIAGTPQVSVVWYNKDVELLCKGRFDILKGDSIVDLKSTKDASWKKFKKDMYNLNYHVQAWMYQDAWAYHNNGELLPFIFACVENNAPYGLASYAIREDSLELGKKDAEEAMRTYKQCLETNEWPGYPDYTMDIDVPEYAIKYGLEAGEI